MDFEKIIFQNTYVELETPPFMEKSILNFHFDYLTISLNIADNNSVAELMLMLRIVLTSAWSRF